MALTATASSALRSTPSWDETIVPALRKRLEGESRALARRISAASIVSIEENSPIHSKSVSTASYSTYDPREQATSPTYSLRPSGIPRPSLQASRPSVSENRSTTPTSMRAVNGTIPPFTRARTLSQPRLLDRDNQSVESKHGPPLPMNNASRSTSPNIQGRPPDVKPTRIPVARTRTGSISGHAQSIFNSGNPRSDSRNGTSYHSPPPAIDPALDLVTEQREPALTHSAIAAYGRLSPTDDMPTRPSTDSEERPFEHWYRGEVSRNGGVGELRVGRKMEMLDIANFGHKVPSRSATPAGGIEHWRNGGLGRRRAGSIGAQARESFYMEADGEAGTVLDEAPLTDLEGGIDSESELEDRLPPRSASALGIGDVRGPNPGSFVRERTSSRVTQKSGPPSRIPTPTLSRQLNEPPRTPTPSTSATSHPESPQSTPHSTTAPPIPRSQSSTQSPSQTPKRRAKSPSEATASAKKKKKKTKTPPVTQPKRGKEENRRSVAEYPVPGGEDVENAIPSWTQPVPPDGNWDEVVLPAVARKKGLDEHYTKVDGSPQQKSPPSFGPEPAPGTFGYDYSKYRPWPAEDIPMDEFGQRPDTIDEDQPIPPMPLPSDTFDERMRTRTHTTSPAPFVQYYQPAPPQETTVGQPIISVADIPSNPRPAAPPDDEEKGAGCCKCVIM